MNGIRNTFSDATLNINGSVLVTDSDGLLDFSGISDTQDGLPDTITIEGQILQFPDFDFQFAEGSSYYILDAVEPVVVNIPDAQLLQAVRDALGKPEGDITEGDMLVLTSLSAISLGITDLTGLETATELVSLILESNSVSDLSPLAGLQNLQTLNLIGNSVSDMGPLASLTSLSSLLSSR